MSLKTFVDQVKQNQSVNFNEFMGNFRQTEVPAPLPLENVQQFGSFPAVGGDVMARKALSDRAREVQAAQAFYAEHNNRVPEEYAHMRGFFRHDPTDEHSNVSDLMWAGGLILPREAGSAVARVLQGLGEPPKSEDLQKMTDEQLVENYPRILQFAQIAASAHRLLGDNLFRESHQTLQQLDAMQEELEFAVRRMDLIASPYYAVADSKAMQNNSDIARNAQVLRENRERIVSGSNGTIQAAQVDALAEYCDAAVALQQAQNKYISRGMERAMAANAAQGYGISRVSAPPVFYTVSGELVKGADGMPAQVDSAEVFAALQNGGSLIGMQGGKATQFSLANGGNLQTLKSEEPAPMAAENQLKNITSDSIDAMLRGIREADSAMLFFTGSREYKALRAQAETFQKKYTGVDISSLNFEERSRMLEDVNALHSATQNYLNYKYDQRDGDLSGSGRKYEKPRIDAAQVINQFTELAAAELRAANHSVEQIKQRRDDGRHIQNYGGYIPIKDQISGSLMTYYGELAGQTKSEAVKELAQELYANAILLGEYSTKVMGDEEKAKYQDLLTKMVAVDMLTHGQVGPASGKQYDPAKEEETYTQNKEGFLKKVSDMLPESVSEVSINVLATGDHGKQIANITAGVYKNMEKDQVSKSLTSYYGQLARQTKSDSVRELAQELSDNANLLGDYSTKDMKEEERAKYQDLLVKMVVVNMLTTEQVGLDLGQMNPPAKIEQIYTAGKKGFLETVSGMMPKNASEQSIYDLATGDHRKQIANITQVVSQNMKQVGAQQQVVSKENEMAPKEIGMEPKAPMVSGAPNV